MGLAEQQKALARLYTDTDLREQFLIEPVNVGKEIGLNEDEAKKLSEVSKDELTFFSESLVWKRLNEVTKLLPLVRKAVGKDFEKMFFEFSATYNPTGVKKHLEDTIAFCSYLEKRVEGDWIFDLIRFEKAFLEFNGLNRKCLVRCFSFDLRKAIENLSNDENVDSIEKKCWCGIWLRLGKKGKAKFYRIFIPSVLFLRHLR